MKHVAYHHRARFDAQLGDAHDAVTTVAETRDLDREIERRSQPFTRGLGREAGPSRREVCRDPKDGLTQRRRARRSEHAIHAVSDRIDDLGRYRPGEGAYDEPVGVNPRGGANGANAFFGRLAEKNRDGVRLVEDELVVLLQHHDAVVGAAGGGERADEGRRAGADRARHEDIRARSDALREEPCHRPRDRAAPHQIVEREIRALRLAQDDDVTLIGCWREHGEHPRALGQTPLGVDLARFERPSSCRRRGAE